MMTVQNQNASKGQGKHRNEIAGERCRGARGCLKRKRRPR
jgi:hypothetical protein